MGMKIDFSSMSEVLVLRLMNNPEIDLPKSKVKSIINIIEETIETNLLCNGCGKLLPDQAFYTQKGAFNRRQKSSLCKQCYKGKYRESS